MSTNVLLLPGFHGTTALFDSLIEAAPSWARPVPLPLPVEPLDSYNDVFDRMIDQVREARPGIIVAESFSGPLAVLLTRELGASVSSLVLVSTFVRFPYRRFRRLLPWAALGRFGRRPSVLRTLLTGGDAEWAGRLSVEAYGVPRDVFDSRVSAVVHVDVSKEFRALACQLMILAGTKDRLVRSPCSREMSALRPDATVERIVAPHLVNQMAPEEVWKRISPLRHGD